MTKAELNILAHLKPIPDYADTYFGHVSKYMSDKALYHLTEKVKKWVEKNGGRFLMLSEKEIRGERKGFIAKIVFPTYNKRDMKSIMATLWEQ